MGCRRGYFETSNIKGQFMDGFKECCFQLREQIEQIKPKVLDLKKHAVFEGEQKHQDQHGEMKANIMLSYRHLEDARMRLGKVIQAFEGKSCYDR